MKSKYEDKLILNIIQSAFLMVEVLEKKCPEVLVDLSPGGVASYVGNNNICALNLLSAYAANKLDKEDFSIYTESQLKDIIKHSDEIAHICLSVENPNQEKMTEIQERAKELYSQLGVIVQSALMTSG